jgi:hypothetical protein
VGGGGSSTGGAEPVDDLDFWGRPGVAGLAPGQEFCLRPDGVRDTRGTHVQRKARKLLTQANQVVGFVIDENVLLLCEFVAEERVVDAGQLLLRPRLP